MNTTMLRTILWLALGGAALAQDIRTGECPVTPAPGTIITRGAGLTEAAGGGMAGDGWEGSGENTAVIWFHVENASADFTNGQRTAMLDGLQAWADVVEIHFYEIARANYDQAIDISFQTDDHSAFESDEAGDPDCPFDGPSGVVAHAGFPPGVASTCIDPMSETFAGNVHFDDDETWEQDNSNDDVGLTLTRETCHEVGHALGLTHSTGDLDVMKQGISAATSFTGLTSNDIANIQEGYASGSGSVTTLEETGVWVDNSYTGTELGLPPWPMDTFAEGAAGVPPLTTDVEVHILPGTYDEPAITITQAMILIAENGTVVIK